MLICLLKEKAADKSSNFDIDALTVSDLNALYKEAKAKFDADPQFRDRAREEVYHLQSGPETGSSSNSSAGSSNNNRVWWRKICDISRREYQEIYDLLDIDITERGESFYQPHLAAIIESLEQKKLLVDSEGSKCLYIWNEEPQSGQQQGVSEGVSKYLNQEDKPLPIILQKSDGAYLYATTDLAAIRHRIDEGAFVCCILLVVPCETCR
jgi:arginyl-tRNA synthetase